MASKKKSRFRKAAAAYLTKTHRPLNCLMFILPLLVAYEVGSYFCLDFQAVPVGLAAPKWLAAFLGLFGATGRILPALLIVLVLLIWHIAAKETWHVDADAVGGMAAESIVLWLPLLAMSLLIGRLLSNVDPAPAQVTASTLSALSRNLDQDVGLAGRIIWGIGSGIYEEFLFRLVAISLILFVTVDLLGAPRKYMAPIAIVVLSILFGLYHFQDVGEYSEPFTWYRLTFRIAAAGYLSILYIGRGFGVAVGAHACYNVMLELLKNT